MTATFIGAVQPHSGRLQQRFEHLEQTGRVLYVAAHPDDENTQLLAHLTWGQGISAAYLSLTRGGGGQNLLGAEQGEALGVMRSHELMEARRLDGAQQFFTRAVDFGFAKSAQESLGIWGHQEILADVVRSVRYFRPHVIVTRFPEEGQTHGHHLASAILAREAFAAAADAGRFVEQLDELEPWQATRLVYNLPFWRMDPNTDTSEFLAVDVGGYNPLLGQSYGELSAASRTMHKSQGFGTQPRVGPKMEYFTFVAGEKPQGRDPFVGIGPSWQSLLGGPEVVQSLQRARAAFDPRRPELAIGELMNAWALAAKLDDSALRRTKRDTLAELALACAGVVLRALVPRAELAVGQKSELVLEALIRRQAAATLKTVLLPGQTVQVAHRLSAHSPWRQELNFKIAASHELSIPYWLRQPMAHGRYQLNNLKDLHHPVGPEAFVATFVLELAGHTLQLQRPLEHVRRDPILGEVRQAAAVFPPVTLTSDTTAIVVAKDRPQHLTYTLRALVPKAVGAVRFVAPKGFRLEPAQVAFELDDVGESIQLSVQVNADEDATLGDVEAAVRMGQQGWAQAWGGVAIDYPHIARQTLLQPSAVRVQTAEIKGINGLIGYVPGAGDGVAGSLRRLGLNVRELDGEALASANLSAYRAILVGPRAFNINAELVSHHARLLDYVHAGGTLVLQYQTNTPVGPLPIQKLGPHPFTISRDRVTDEAAPVRLLAPDHALLHTPHSITAADFEGWVQERGLYFATDWTEHSTAILEMSDADEEPSGGALLASAHGKGMFIYTGLSFFRQLPAGVPGAYRLLINLLATSQQTTPVPSAGAVVPPLGGWSAMYLLVLGGLAGVVILLYLVTLAYR